MVHSESILAPVYPRVLIIWELTNGDVPYVPEYQECQSYEGYMGYSLGVWPTVRRVMGECPTVKRVKEERTVNTQQ